MLSGEALRSTPSVSYGSFTAASARRNIRRACRWLDRGAAQVGPSVIRSAALRSDREQRHRLGALNRGSGKVPNSWRTLRLQCPLLGQKQTFRSVRPMSALPPKADIDRHALGSPKVFESGWRQFRVMNRVLSVFVA